MQTATPTIEPGPPDADAVLKTACLDSLATFSETMLAPGYRAAAMHTLIAQKLELCYARKIKRLIVACPPRHGKSQLISIAFPVWALTRDPHLNFIQVGYSSELSESFCRATKAIIESPTYRKSFAPLIDTTLDRAREFRTLSGGAYYSTGIGAGGLGRGADFLIVDDPFKNRDAADSLLERDRVWDWFSSTAITRLSPDGVVIVVMSRWNQDDLVGRLTAPAYDGPKYEVLSLPAIADGEGDLLGRAPGAALWPERWGLERLNDIRLAIGRRDWGSHYQAAPTPEGGTLCDTAKIRLIDREQLPPDLEQARAWDLALGTTAHHDYSAGARGGMKDGNFYIADINRGRRPWEIQKEVIVAHGKTERGRVGIETVSAWQVAADELTAALAGHAVVRSLKVSASKEARATGWISLVEAGKLFLVRAPWNDAFIAELAAFPSGAFDDQVDSVSLLWELVRKRDQIFFACSETPWQNRGGLHGDRLSRFFT
jgi:predicted phage terminase large subunit-like protein